MHLHHLGHLFLPLQTETMLRDLPILRWSQEPRLMLTIAFRSNGVQQILLLILIRFALHLWDIMVALTSTPLNSFLEGLGKETRMSVIVDAITSTLKESEDITQTQTHQLPIPRRHISEATMATPEPIISRSTTVKSKKTPTITIPPATSPEATLAPIVVIAATTTVRSSTELASKTLQAASPISAATKTAVVTSKPNSTRTQRKPLRSSSVVRNRLFRI